MNFGALPERLAHVRAEIARRQVAAGRTGLVTIVAVTKGFGVEAAQAALAAGITDLGENRVQEALQKLDAPAVAGRQVAWHLIGHLQRNKAKYVVGRFALVHSLDSAELADELNRRASPGARQRVLLQVNVAGEVQKSGCSPAAAPGLARHIVAQPHLALEGLMTIAPFTDDQDVQRRTFRGLRALRDALQQEEDLWLPTLSMGMSADYGVAVEEGATVIRLGTVLFGPRTQEEVKYPRAPGEAERSGRAGGAT